jgi:hypothetical protein
MESNNNEGNWVKMDGIGENTDKSTLITCLEKEIKGIRTALRALGYFAYSVNFYPPGKGEAPIIKIEARGWNKGDEKLIGNF